ncbi:Hydrogenase maturation protein, carbamoyl dehydratase HypE [Clostridium cavendishii DSM 21758]|uniref:Hydrogenase maturation protein, carbamoyl dehydratase HypE n=2 Tax=Clostridium TaxID=1485 RepID=A0A1M6LF54_9CLOT|nr:Hydrogenase maturation protein, carbamoyl dehydratase HypE [Clostridium cavendishii DSM 21758]
MIIRPFLEYIEGDFFMKIGKLNWTDLKNLINRNNTVKREEVRIRSGIGEDCSVVNFGDYECVISTDPITGTTKDIGRLAVHINCNDIASSGVEPLGITVTILAPEDATLEDINKVMQEINEETTKLNVEIIGGHTEVTSAVTRMVVSCTVFGRCISGKAVASSTAEVGDDIIVTKYLASEGTAILANDHKERCEKILTTSEYNEALKMINNISVVKEGVIAGEIGVNSMHDITEGGLLGALWEVCEASDVGFEVNYDKLPIKDVTKKICKEFNINPLKLISSGSMLMTSKYGKDIVKELNKNNIKADIIGKITDSNKVMMYNGEKIYIDAPETDDLFNIK